MDLKKMGGLFMRILLLLITLVSTCDLASAEQSGEIMLRFSRLDDGSVRVVFEAGEQLVRNANTIATLGQIKVEFPGKFELKKQGDFPYAVVKSDRFVTIELKDVTDVRAYKLTDPSRLVIHLKTATKHPVFPASSHQAPQKMQQEGTKTQTDIKKPAATQQLPEKKQKAGSIALDAGHGGYDFGLVGEQTKEKELNLALARDLSDILIKKGYRPFLLRKTDQYLSIHDRILLANSKKHDLLISIHSSSLNAFVITVASGDDVPADAPSKLYGLSSRQARHMERSRAFAGVLSELIKAVYKTEVTVQELPLPLLSSLDSPALLIEYPSFTAGPYDQKSKEKLLDTLVKAISSYEQ